MFCLYRNRDLDEQIFNCLLTAMTAVKAEDMRGYFLFLGDLNGHHQEWLGSTITYRYCVASFHFATVSGCE